MDHVYVNNSATVNNVNFINPTFGDHVLVMSEINLRVAEKPNFQLRRDWHCYSELRQKFRIVNLLSSLNVNYDVLNVQELWNVVENVIIECIDKCTPLVSVNLNLKKSPSSIPSHVKNAMNKRKQFLHLDRIRSNAVNASHIKILNKEISSHFNGVKTEAVRKAAMGGKVNLWKAVKVAKNQNVESISENLTLGGGASHP